MSLGLGLHLGLSPQAIGAAAAETHDGLRISLINVTAEMRPYGAIVQDKFGNNIVPVKGIAGAATNDFDDISAGEYTHTSTFNSGTRGLVQTTEGQLRSVVGDGGIDFYMKFDTSEEQPSRIYIPMTAANAFWEDAKFYLLKDGIETEIFPTSEPSGVGDTTSDMTFIVWNLYRFDFSVREATVIPAIASGTGNLDSVVQGVCGEFDVTKTASFDPDTDATIMNDLTVTPALGESITLFNGQDAGTRLTHTGTKGTSNSRLEMTAGDEFLFFDELKEAIALNTYGRSDLDYKPYIVMCGNFVSDGVQKYLWGGNDDGQFGAWQFLGSSDNLHTKQNISSTQDTTLINSDLVPDGTPFCMVVSFDFAGGTIHSSINSDTFTVKSTTWRTNVLDIHQENSSNNGNINATTTGGKFGVTTAFRPSIAGLATFRKNIPDFYPLTSEFVNFSYGVSSSLLTNTELAAIMAHYATEHGVTYVP